MIPIKTSSRKILVLDEELGKLNTFSISRSFQFGAIGEEYMSRNIDKVLR